jgi:hypothetical protein
MFLFSKLDDSAIERIIYHMLEKTCEIDAMSFRYDAIINLLKSLKEEGDEDVVRRVESIIKRYINDRSQYYIFAIAGHDKQLYCPRAIGFV